MASIKDILTQYMQDNEITSISGLATKLNIEYKTLDKLLNGRKMPSTSDGYKLLMDMKVDDATLELFFKDTYGCGNDAYLQMMKGKLEADYAKSKKTNSLD